MIKFILYLTLFVLVACGSLPRKSLQSHVREAKYHVIKEKTVTSESDAKTYMQNQLNFLNLLYQQSRDPYYGQPKWPEECLEANKIGKIEVKDKYIWTVSDLYMNAQGDFGHCPGSRIAGRGYFILLYCMNKKDVVYDIRVQYDPKLDFDKLEFCP